MGAEYLVTGVGALGLVAFALLVWRAATAASRPYSLPTLVFASASGVYLASGSSLWNSVLSFFTYFLGAALVFGAQAYAIRWLREPK